MSASTAATPPVLQAPSPQAMPSAALIQIVAAVVRLRMPALGALMQDHAGTKKADAADDPLDRAADGGRVREPEPRLTGDHGDQARAQRDERA